MSCMVFFFPCHYWKYNILSKECWFSWHTRKVLLHGATFQSSHWFYSEAARQQGNMPLTPESPTDSSSCLCDGRWTGGRWKGYGPHVLLTDGWKETAGYGMCSWTLTRITEGVGCESVFSLSAGIHKNRVKWPKTKTVHVQFKSLPPPAFWSGLRVSVSLGRPRDIYNERYGTPSEALVLKPPAYCSDINLKYVLCQDGRKHPHRYSIEEFRHGNNNVSPLLIWIWAVCRTWLLTAMMSIFTYMEFL